MCSTKSGLFIGNKLTYEHLHLNSYSRMKVKLAAQVYMCFNDYQISNDLVHVFQVLSKSVADAFAVCRDLAEPGSLLHKTAETEKFCRLFDKFFDCLNTRSIDEAKYKRKPDLRPYYSAKDSRLKVCYISRIILFYLAILQWLLEDFLGYLDEWEENVRRRKVEKVPKEDKEGTKRNDKKRMLLSKETRDGIRMTGGSHFRVM